MGEAVGAKDGICEGTLDFVGMNDMLGTTEGDKVGQTSHDH